MRGGDGGDRGEAEAGGATSPLRGEVAAAVTCRCLGAAVVEDDDEAIVKDARFELEERTRWLLGVGSCAPRAADARFDGVFKQVSEDGRELGIREAPCVLGDDEVERHGDALLFSKRGVVCGDGIDGEVFRVAHGMLRSNRLRQACKIFCHLFFAAVLNKFREQRDMVL